MNANQIETCKKRNEQVKKDIASSVTITAERASELCTNIDSLVFDLEQMTERARLAQEAARGLQQQLVEEKQHNADLGRAVGPLRDKLSKARAILNRFGPAFTPEEKEDMKDIMKDS